MRRWTARKAIRDIKALRRARPDDLVVVSLRDGTTPAVIEHLLANLRRAFPELTDTHHPDIVVVGGGIDLAVLSDAELAMVGLQRRVGA